MNEASTTQPTETVSQAFERLRLEKETNPGPPKRVPRTMSLNSIQEEPLVFQVRLSGLDKDRVEELSQNLDDMAIADRVRVWWSGTRWILIDGHHRVAAYHLKQLEAGETLQVPVEAHPGVSFPEALGIASKVNAREKVKIDKVDRGNVAWRLVCLEEGSITKQARDSGVSEAQISIMRATLKRLKERGITSGQMIDQGWEWSRQTDKGKRKGDFTADDAEVMAQEWAKKIGIATYGMASQNGDVLARAIQIISPALPSSMIQSDAFWEALDGPGREMLEEADGGEDLVEEETEDF